MKPELNYESWIIIDTKHNTHGCSRQIIGMSYDRKAAELEADYFNWSWNEKGRFKVVQVKVNFEVIQ